MAREVFGSTNEPTYSKPRWQCSAYGCTLPGGLSQGFGEHATYFCRFHYGKKSARNDEITRRLKPFNHLFDVLYLLKASEDIPKISNYFETHGRKEFAANDNEMVDAYKNRIQIALSGEVSDLMRDLNDL